jgi:hypothetical protein
MRQLGDPLADDTVKALFAEHGIDAVNNLWRLLLQNDQIPPGMVPKPVQLYLQQSSQLPVWANPGLIRQGEDFFNRNGVFCLVSLLCASLPECYVYKNEAAVLGTTAKLEDHAYRRIYETTQLIVAVMQEGGLTPGKPGCGIIAAQKVRLMHAAIRHLIRNTSGQKDPATPAKSFTEAIQQLPRWDVAKSGCPINQEELVYTLLTFSYVTLRTMKKLKIEIRPSDIEAYIHCWNVVGHIMGIREELLISLKTYESAETLFEGIKSRQSGASEDGRKLTNALLNCSQQIINHVAGGLVIRSIIKPIPLVLTHLVLDKNTITILDIKKLTFCQRLLQILLSMLSATFAWLYRRLINAWGLKFGQQIVSDLTQIPRGYNRKLFDLPEKLRTSWGIKMPETSATTTSPPTGAGH